MKENLLIITILLLFIIVSFYLFKSKRIINNKHKAGYPYPLTPVKHLKKKISKNSVMPPPSGKVLHKKRVIKIPNVNINRIK